jgi:hypothetical protein
MTQKPSKPKAPIAVESIKHNDATRKNTLHKPTLHKPTSGRIAVKVTNHLG